MTSECTMPGQMGAIPRESWRLKVQLQHAIGTLFFHTICYLMGRLHQTQPYVLSGDAFEAPNVTQMKLEKLSFSATSNQGQVYPNEKGQT